LTHKTSIATVIVATIPLPISIHLDPNGLGWFKKFFRSIGNFFKNIFKKPEVLIAGIVGAALGAWVAAPIISSMSASFAATGTGISFAEGFLIGGVELGLPTFTGRLAGGMASGQKFNQALKGAGIAAGVAFVAGGLIEGTYAAGWQNKFHFSDTRIAEINEIKRAYAKGDYFRAHNLEYVVAQKGISASTARTLGWPAPKRTIWDKIFRWEGKGEPWTEGWRWEYAGNVEADAFVAARAGWGGVTQKWKNYLSYKGWGRYIWDMNDITRIWKYYGSKLEMINASVYGNNYDFVYPYYRSPWE
jgi:hypothetical protein